MPATRRWRLAFEFDINQFRRFSAHSEIFSFSSTQELRMFSRQLSGIALAIVASSAGAETIDATVNPPAYPHLAVGSKTKICSKVGIQYPHQRYFGQRARQDQSPIGRVEANGSQNHDGL
jgi:hypothetical protein